MPKKNEAHFARIVRFWDDDTENRGHKIHTLGKQHASESYGRHNRNESLARDHTARVEVDAYQHRQRFVESEY